MTNKNKNKNNNLSSGGDVTTELFVENKKTGGKEAGGNKALCEALKGNECVMSFGSAHDGDNIRHMNLPLTSLGMGIA